MIYAADGTIATKERLPMTWRHLEWLNDGHSFLRHLNELRDLRLEVICHYCHEKGREDHIDVRALDDEKQYVATCAHAQRRIPFTGVQSADELRMLYHWAFRCRAQSPMDPDCEKRGMYYWVDGRNAPVDKELVLSCGCTDRIYRFPTTGRA